MGNFGLKKTTNTLLITS